MSNGSDAEWKLVCLPPAGMKERIDLARRLEAERQGVKASSITYQYLIPILLREAMDARGVPQNVPRAPSPTDREPSDPGEATK